jgi:K+-transporting ATPase A subunit
MSLFLSFTFGNHENTTAYNTLRMLVQFGIRNHSMKTNLYIASVVKAKKKKQTNKQTNKLRGPLSACELYRLRDRHLLAKFSANFCG